MLFKVIPYKGHLPLTAKNVVFLLTDGWTKPLRGEIADWADTN